MDKYQLTTKNRREAAPFCPCGEPNRTKFCPYEINGKPSDCFGYCHKCERTFLPTDKPGTAYRQLPEQRKKAPQEFVPESEAQATFGAYTRNNLFIYLSTLFDAETLTAGFISAKIGTAKDGSAIFWNVDREGRFTGAKKIQYNPGTGKRVNGKAYRLYTQEKNFTPCLFGLWQLGNTEKKDVCIVESEKTALIMSLVSHKYHWIATGGKAGLNADTLSGQRVFLIPDCDDGRESYKDYEKKGYGTYLDLYPDTTDKSDIADMVLAELIAEKTAKESDLTAYYTDITDIVRPMYAAYLASRRPK